MSSLSQARAAGQLDLLSRIVLPIARWNRARPVRKRFGGLPGQPFQQGAQLSDTDQLRKEDWLKVLGVTFPEKASPYTAPPANRAKVSVAGANAIAKAQSAYPSRPPSSHK